jgi:hypothetical protein
MFQNRSVDNSRFSMIPSANVPRSKFNAQKTHKTTFDAGYLIPIYVDEVLPGDTFNVSCTAFARLMTPLFPIMDNLQMNFFYFFVPNRLVWSNWKKFMGEQNKPGDSTSYLIPQTANVVYGGYPTGSLQDYMGLPTVGQIPGNSGALVRHSALPLRAYNLIWNEWFRDENLQDPVPVYTNDGPDDGSGVQVYNLLRRGKKHDYFTSALPWPQKGQSVSIPLGLEAQVKSNGDQIEFMGITGQQRITPQVNAGGSQTEFNRWAIPQSVTQTTGLTWGDESGLYADLTTASSATINQLRTSFAVQRLLERDARGGTRYTEIVRSHFGVVSPDARLQRPEYLGGGTTSVNISPIAQTTATGVTGASTPLGTLGAMGTALSLGNGFTSSFTEHGIIIGLVSVQADLTYQQGLEKQWSRKTRYDFYFPAFAHLGEQAILNKEIYCDGSSNDELVFGYQERWAEYRYKPSMITGQFRSTAAGTLDAWHLSQRFTSCPTLNSSFIQDNPPVDRVTAVAAGQDTNHFYLDAFFNINMVRPLPMYSVPGLIDHF